MTGARHPATGSRRCTCGGVVQRGFHTPAPPWDTCAEKTGKEQRAATGRESGGKGPFVCLTGGLTTAEAPSAAPALRVPA